jgi:hypothetical protein
MSSSATGVGMPICFLGAILLILTQKSSQKFGDVLGIMVLDLLLPKYGVHKDTARLCFGNPKTPRSTMRAEKFCSRWSQKVSVPTVSSISNGKHTETRLFFAEMLH